MIKEVVKEAIRKTILENPVGLKDSLFIRPPDARKKRHKGCGSTEHDLYLYEVRCQN